MYKFNLAEFEQDVYEFIRIHGTDALNEYLSPAHYIGDGLHVNMAVFTLSEFLGACSVIVKQPSRYVTWHLEN